MDQQAKINAVFVPLCSFLQNFDDGSIWSLKNIEFYFILNHYVYLL